MSRRDMLAKVHLAKKEMALTEDSYRDLLERVTGKRSAKDLTDAQLERVLGEFRRLGFAAKPKRKPSQKPHVRKCWALWLALADAGQVDRKGLPGFVKRMTGVDDPEWLDPAKANKVIEALKGWGERVGVS